MYMAQLTVNHHDRVTMASLVKKMLLHRLYYFTLQVSIINFVFVT